MPGHSFGALGRRLGRTLLAAVATLVLAAPPGRAGPPDAAPGATVDELLALARRVNPDLAAARLDADAALARAAAAGALDDPLFKVEFQDVDRRRGSVLPGKIGSVFYRVEQDFPLWGKRDLRREVGAAEALNARERGRAVAAELAARVKIAFAQHYEATDAIRINTELDGLLRTVSAAAQIRAAQALGSQPEILQAEAERTRLAVERSGLERDQATARVRINGLLDRPAEAPLASPRALRPLPPLASQPLSAVVARMEASNPELAAESATRAAAAGERRLADKAWYPDVTLGASVVDRSGTVTGYEAMVGVRVPLQWGVKEAMQREAGAKYGAADARVRGIAAKARSDLAQAWEGLQAAQRTEQLIGRRLLPQSEAAWRSVLAEYQAGRSEFALLLEAERRLQQARLDLLRARAEQQVMLAEIERIVGEEP
jgi:outer membrane protein, heavy metal efflux system